MAEDDRQNSFAVDFRVARMKLPPCDECGTANTYVAVREEWVFYIRCRECGAVWSIPRPDRTPLGD